MTSASATIRVGAALAPGRDTVTTPDTPPPAPRAGAAKPNPFLEIAVTIVVPSLVLIQLSGDDWLGRVGALMLALAFPVGWGLWDGMRRHKVNWLAVIGAVSTLITGGIALLQIDTQWLAVKEASISALIGLVVAASAWTRRPLIQALVFDASLFDVDRIRQRLAKRRSEAEFEARLRTGTLLLAGTFAFSAVANFFLTRWVVTSPSGSEAFNQELGRLTLLSYPVIAIPSMLMMMALMWWLAQSASRLTGLTVAELFGPEPTSPPAGPGQP